MPAVSSRGLSPTPVSYLWPLGRANTCSQSTSRARRTMIRSWATRRRRSSRASKMACSRTGTACKKLPRPTLQASSPTSTNRSPSRAVDSRRLKATSSRWGEFTTWKRASSATYLNFPRTNPRLARIPPSKTSRCSKINAKSALLMKPTCNGRRTRSAPINGWCPTTATS